MTISTIKKLNEIFRGKICTVLTVGVNKNNFTDIQFSDFFTGFIEQIDDDGVWTKHHLTGCKNFYPMSQVVSILEEQVVQESDPQYEKLMEQVNKSEVKPITQKYDPKNSPFVNPEMLAALAKQAQQIKK